MINSPSSDHELREHMCPDGMYKLVILVQPASQRFIGYMVIVVPAAAPSAEPRQRARQKLDSSQI